jgi:nitrite reductase/ring-hydroxylating ferredoxin subunit
VSVRERTVTGGFIAVARDADVVENRVHCVQVQGHGIVLARFDGAVHALENRCTHGDATFDKGRVRAHRLLCPLHGAIFDLRSGAVLGPPAMKPLRTFPVRIVDGVIEVDLQGS